MEVSEEQLVERFWNKVDIRNKDDCWIWTASIRANYGAFKYKGKMVIEET